MSGSSAMSLSEVRRVLDALTSVCDRFWLEGGWGVDALVGQQTRPHRDLDVDLDADCEAAGLDALSALGYVIETDWRPNRVELVAPGGYVDLHPLVIGPAGDARQAAVDGGWHYFPRSFFTTGRIGGLTIPCVSIEAQRLFRRDYELRDVDLHDLAMLDTVARRQPSQ